MKKITEKISIEISKNALKFFGKNKNIYYKFLENIKSFYHNHNSNIDIKALKNYKNLYRMRINKYRVIYKLVNGELMIISVIAVDSRGQIYKKI